MSLWFALKGEFSANGRQYLIVKAEIFEAPAELGLSLVSLGLVNITRFLWGILPRYFSCLSLFTLLAIVHRSIQVILHTLLMITCYQRELAKNYLLLLMQQVRPSQ